ncbi:MAG: biotin transporter BioY [Coriobacteriales bacterium]
MPARRVAVAALMAALIAASAWVSVPAGDVPVTLQTLVIVLAACVLRPGEALSAVGVYVLAGAVGLPVFAGGKAGLVVLAGPTGGFLIGFIVGAAVGAWVREQTERSTSGSAADALAALSVLAIVYLSGWAHIAFVLGAGPVAAFAGAVLPFLVPDAIKAAGAVWLAAALRRSGAVARAEK